MNRHFFFVQACFLGLLLSISSNSHSQDRGSRGTPRNPEVRSVVTTSEAKSPLKVHTKRLKINRIDIPVYYKDRTYHFDAPIGANRSGKCLLWYSIDEKGEVTGISVEECTENFFVQPAIEALSSHRFKSGQPSRPGYFDHSLYIVFDHIGTDGGYVPAFGDKSLVEIENERLRKEEVLAFNRCQTPEYLVEKAKMNFQIYEGIEGDMWLSEEVDELTKSAMKDLNESRRISIAYKLSSPFKGRSSFRERFIDSKREEDKVRKKKYFEKAKLARAKGELLEPISVAKRNCEDIPIEPVEYTWRERSLAKQYDKLFDGFVTPVEGEDINSLMSKKDKNVLTELISIKTGIMKRVFDNSSSTCMTTSHTVGAYRRIEVGKSTQCDKILSEGFSIEFRKNSHLDLDKEKFSNSCKEGGLTRKFCGCVSDRLDGYVSADEFNLFFESPRAYARYIALQRNRNRAFLSIPSEYRGVDKRHFEGANWVQNPSARYQSMILGTQLVEEMEICLIDIY